MRLGGEAQSLLLLEGLGHSGRPRLVDPVGYISITSTFRHFGSLGDGLDNRGLTTVWTVTATVAAAITASGG